MKQAIIHRLFGTEFQMLGTLFTITGNQLFVAKTLELPDKNNQRKISCIPTTATVGRKYLCEWGMSTHLNRACYHITDVPGRDGILFHPANYAIQLLGCVAMGSALKDINNDGHQDVIHSGATMEEFENIMNEEPFELTIVDFSKSLIV